MGDRGRRGDGRGGRKGYLELGHSLTSSSHSLITDGQLVPVPASPAPALPVLHPPAPLAAPSERLPAFQRPPAHLPAPARLALPAADVHPPVSVVDRVSSLRPIPLRVLHPSLVEPARLELARRPAHAAPPLRVLVPPSRSRNGPRRVARPSRLSCEARVGRLDAIYVGLCEEAVQVRALSPVPSAVALLVYHHPPPGCLKTPPLRT